MSKTESEVRKKLDFSEESGRPGFVDSTEYRKALDVIDTLSFDEIEEISRKIEKEAASKEDFKLNDETQKLHDEINKFLDSTDAKIKNKAYKEAAEQLSRAIELATQVQMSIVQNRLFYRIANKIITHPQILKASAIIAGLPSIYLAKRSEVELKEIFIDRPLLLKFKGIMSWNIAQRPEVTIPSLPESEKGAIFIPSYLQLSKQSAGNSSSPEVTENAQPLSPLRRSPKIQRFE